MGTRTHRKIQYALILILVSICFTSRSFGDTSNTDLSHANVNTAGGNQATSCDLGDNELTGGAPTWDSCDDSIRFLFKSSSCTSDAFKCRQKCNAAKCDVSETTMCGTPPTPPGKPSHVITNGIDFESYYQCLKYLNGGKCPLKAGVEDTDCNAQVSAAPALDTKEKKYPDPTPAPSPLASPKPKVSADEAATQIGKNLQALRDQTAVANILGAPCASLQMGIPAKQMGLKMAGTSAAGAAVCWAACAAAINPFDWVIPGVIAALNTACVVTDIATIATEAAFVNDMTNNEGMKPYGDYFSNNFMASSVKSMSGTQGGALASAGAAAVAAGTAAHAWGKEIGKKIGYKLLVKSETRTAASIAPIAGACLAAALITTSATAQWMGVYGANGIEEGMNKQCSSIIALNGPGTAITQLNGGSGTSPIGGASAPGSGSSGAAKSADFSNFAAQGVGKDALNDDDITDTGPSVGLATAGLSSLAPEQQKIKDALKMLGTSTKELTAKLTTMGPGAAIASSIPNLPDDVKDALLQQDKDFKEGRLQFVNNLPGATPSGGGGGGMSSASSAPKPFVRAIAFTPGTAKAEMTFDKPAAKAEPMLPSDGDIWHTSWNGNIFQLVDLRMRTIRDRIEPGEWSSPLNRALMGLPRLAPAIPQKKSGG